MVGAGGVAGRRTDPAVLLADQIFAGQFFAFAKPPRFARALVQIFGKGFGQTIGQCFGHDRVVIVMVPLELLAKFLDAKSRADGKGTEIIFQAGARGCDEIRKRVIELAVSFFDLLPQKMKFGQCFLA